MMNWNALHDRLLQAAPSLELRRDEPMSRHTTFRVGGPAALMALPRTVGETKAVLKAAYELNIDPFFLGNGSNLLVSGSGYDGFVVKPGEPYSRGEVYANELMAGGAMSLSRAANLALEHGLTGLEGAAGIPGTVGGAVAMNAGAYGGEISQVLHQVHTLGYDGRFEVFRNEECDFSYRHSVFLDEQHLILEAVFILKPGDPAEIKAQMDDFAQRRREKQPLEYPSAGSTFKRPPAVDGQPVYAAALIDGCGLKGLTVGGAQVSEKHAGFIVNKGGAACQDIVELIVRVRERVFQETGITLEPEVRYLGREGEGWNF